MGTLVAERSLRVFGPPYEDFRAETDWVHPGAVPDGSALVWWLCGASALGSLSGYTTAVSKGTTSGNELMKFLSGGLISLVGGAASFLRTTTKEVTEKEYVDNLVKKQEFTSGSSVEGPETLVVVGSFLFFFCLFAALGTVVGAYIKKSRGAEIVTLS